MKFYFESSIPDRSKAVCVDAKFSAKLHLSHWRGNLTPTALKGDTSTATVMNLLQYPLKQDYLNGIEFAANNHYDVDGVLAVFTLLYPDIALANRQLILDAAATGDFNEYASDEALKVCAALESLESNTVEYNLSDYPAFVEMLYDKAFSMIPSLLADPDSHRALWRHSFDIFLISESSFISKQSIFSDYQDCNLSCIESPLDLHPVAIDKWAGQDRLLVARKDANAGYSYLITYKNYTWFDTTRTDSRARVPLEPLAAKLNLMETKTDTIWEVIGNSPEVNYDYRLISHNGKFEPASSSIALFEVENELMNYFFEADR